MTSAVAGSRQIGDFNNTATFMIPNTGESVKLSGVFETMKARPDDAGIVDWALRQTSMEEVFLRIAHASEVAQAKEMDEGSAHNGKKVKAIAAPATTNIEMK